MLSESSPTPPVKGALIVDFMNATRSHAKHYKNSDGLFHSLEDYSESIRAVCQHIMQVEKQGVEILDIYYVTKPFKIGDVDSASVIKFTLEKLTEYLPLHLEIQQLCVIDSQIPDDRERDDRALFILGENIQSGYSNTKIFILSKDEFNNIGDHICKPVMVHFYSLNGAIELIKQEMSINFEKMTDDLFTLLDESLEVRKFHLKKKIDN